MSGIEVESLLSNGSIVQTGSLLFHSLTLNVSEAGSCIDIEYNLNQVFIFANESMLKMQSWNIQFLFIVHWIQLCIQLPVLKVILYYASPVQICNWQDPKNMYIFYFELIQFNLYKKNYLYIWS